MKKYSKIKMLSLKIFMLSVKEQQKIISQLTEINQKAVNTHLEYLYNVKLSCPAQIINEVEKEIEHMSLATAPPMVCEAMNKHINNICRDSVLVTKSVKNLLSKYAI